MKTTYQIRLNPYNIQITYILIFKNTKPFLISFTLTLGIRKNWILFFYSTRTIKRSTSYSQHYSVLNTTDRATQRKRIFDFEEIFMRLGFAVFASQTIYHTNGVKFKSKKFRSLSNIDIHYNIWILSIYLLNTFTFA